MNTIDSLLDSIKIPRVVRIKQRFDRPVLQSVKKTCISVLRSRRHEISVSPGMSVAVTAGSRGITNLSVIMRSVIDELKSWGANPFIIPAMGSHGGATAEGQEALLAKLGITKDSIGVPIVSSMDTVQIGMAKNGLPVNIDRAALSADAIVLLNRVKPHVSFRGKFESGLLKMIAIGLGKQHGAEICHNLGFEKMEENIIAIAEEALKHLNITCAIAILENPYHETASIEVLLSEELFSREPKLLDKAKSLFPRLYIRKLDVLIMDQIGKNIAGSGFDTNVVGRYHTTFIKASKNDAQITRIAALDLTLESLGNANGVGALDYISERLYKKIVTEQMYPNSLTSTVPTPVKIPMTLRNDRQVIQASIRTANIPDIKNVRFARIRNTQELESLEISENLIEEAQNHPLVNILSEPYDMLFDSKGNLF